MQTIPASTAVRFNQPRAVRMFGSRAAGSSPAGVALRVKAVVVDSKSRRGIRGRVVTRAAGKPEPPRAFSTDLSDNQNLESLMEREAQPAVQVRPSIDPFPSPRRSGYRPGAMDARAGSWTIRTRVRSGRVPNPTPRAPRHPPVPVGTRPSPHAAPRIFPSRAIEFSPPALPRFTDRPRLISSRSRRTPRRTSPTTTPPSPPASSSAAPHCWTSLSTPSTRMSRSWPSANT